MTELVVEADVARKAATYIREHGLAKGELVLPDGSACFNGAIILAFAPEDYTIPEEPYKLWLLLGESAENTKLTGIRELTFDRIGRKASRILVARGVNPRNCDVVKWNNAESRTAEEVANLLDEVAEELSRA